MAENVNEFFNPQTRYVRNKMKKTKWKDRSYIEQLIRLEKIISKTAERQPLSEDDKIVLMLAVTAYSDEYMGMMKEMNPERFMKEKETAETAARKKRELMKSKSRNISKEEKEKLARMKKEWKMLGGRT